MAKVRIVVRSNKLADGSKPIAIRLSHKNTPTTYIRLSGFSVASKNEWDSGLSRFTNKKMEYKYFNKLLTDIEIKIDTITTKLVARNEFTYDRFRSEYIGNTDVDDNVINVYKAKITSLEKVGKDGTATTYKSSLASLKKPLNGLTFSDITYSLLKKFEQSQRLIGNGGNTISIHLRCLRALHYDYCKRADIPNPTAYIKFNINRLRTPTAKRSLTKGQLKNLISYTPKKNTMEGIAKDIFLFSLITRGMNLFDIAQLTADNITEREIAYVRSKTGTQFTVTISDDIQEIFDRYVNNSKYLFPIIKQGQNIRKSVSNFNTSINDALKRIARKADLPERLSFYYARHTFATLARESGVGIELISQALGHKDLKTTKIYLRSFKTEQLDDITNQILKGL